MSSCCLQAVVTMERNTSHGRFPATVRSPHDTFQSVPAGRRHAPHGCLLVPPQAPPSTPAGDPAVSKGDCGTITPPLPAETVSRATAVNILRLEKHSKNLVARLCLVTDCPQGSAALPAGRPANAVRSQPEPGYEMFTAVPFQEPFHTPLQLQHLQRIILFAHPAPLLPCGDHILQMQLPQQQGLRRDPSSSQRRIVFRQHTQGMGNTLVLAALDRAVARQTVTHQHPGELIRERLLHNLRPATSVSAKNWCCLGSAFSPSRRVDLAITPFFR